MRWRCSPCAGFDHIEQLEQQLAATTAGSGEPAEGAALNCEPLRNSTIQAVTPIAPVFVASVDVAPLATAANIVGLLGSAASDEWATEGAALGASLRMARVLVQKTFEDLRAASAGGAP